MTTLWATGVRTALTIGAGATILPLIVALIVALIAIRVRKEDLLAALSLPRLWPAAESLLANRRRPAQ